MTLKMVRTLSISVLALLLAAGCNKSVRNDAQVASDIQGKINADQAIQNKQIAVTAANGVVTLAGAVSSDNERSAAASDAATVAGVRTVVNNLTVQPGMAAQSAPPEQPPAAAPPAQQPATTTRKPGAAHAKSQAAQNSDQYSQAQPPANDASQQQQQASQNAPTPAPTAPAPPPPPAEITIPAGTTLAVRMLDTVDSETANAGDTFRATLNAPVVVDGRTVIPADSDVYGRVVDAHAAKRFSGSGLLTIEIVKVGFNGRTYAIHSSQWSKQTASRGKGTAEKVGGGAALGAIIGAIAGGGKGAAVGSAVGAGAGGVTQAAIKAAQIKLGPESLLNFNLTDPVKVLPSAGNDRNAGRQQLN